MGDIREVILKGMEQARTTWTDERLDDMSRRMDNGFGRLDQDLRSVNVRIDALEGRMDARFDALHRALLQIGGGLIASVLVGFASLIATRL